MNRARTRSGPAWAPPVAQWRALRQAPFAARGGRGAGAGAGPIAGPVGTMVGGVIGAVVGGLAGKAAAEAVNPTAEEQHWRDNYTGEPYYEQGRSFDDYGPAYQHGMRGRMTSESDWDVAEPRLASEWQDQRAGSG